MASGGSCDENQKAKAETKCDHLDSLSSHLITIPHPHTPCNRCGDRNDNWLCLKCKVILCSRYVNMHMLEHYEQTNHCLVLRIRFGDTNLLVWCCRCNTYLDHRVVSPPLAVDINDYAIKYESKPGTEGLDDDEVFWEGHLVNESYVELLSKIKKAHPQTFEHLSSFRTPTGRMVCTVALSTFAKFYNMFASKKVVEMTMVDIGTIEDNISDLELMRFNVGWLRERLGVIKEMQSKSHFFCEYKELAQRVKAKEKELKELKNDCITKAFSVSPTFGFLGEKILTWCAADDLL